MSTRGGSVRRGVLQYNTRFGRFEFEDRETVTAISCGHVLAIRIGAHYAWGRIEIDQARRWYMIFPSLSGRRSMAVDLRTGSVYDAQVPR